MTQGIEICCYNVHRCKPVYVLLLFSSCHDESAKYQSPKNKSPIWRRFVRLSGFHCLDQLSIILAGNCHYTAGISIMSNSKVIVIMARSFLDLQATPFIHDMYALFLLRHDCYNDGLIPSVFIAHTFSLKKNNSPEFFKKILHNLTRRMAMY